MFTLKDMLRRAVLLNGAGAAVIDDDRTYAWAEFAGRVRAIAGSLAERGFRRGDRLAILGLNGPRHFEMHFATLWAGGTVVPVNTRYAPPELVHNLADAGGPWVCVDDEMLPRLEAVRASVPGIRGLLHMGTQPCPPGYVPYDALLGGDPAAATVEPTVDDLSLIYYTGGTTGAPKGVMLTHGQMLAGSQHWASAFEGLSRDDVYLHLAPMFHMADGVMCFTTAIATCANVFLPRFDLQAVVDACNRHRVTCLLLVPAMARMLCLHLADTGQSIPSLRLIVYGASPMPRPVLDLVMQTFPHVRLYHGYGATETLSITILGPEHHTRDERGERMMRSCGQPFPGVLLDVKDPARRSLPPGRVGEVCVRSNSVMQGYWNQPTLTQEVLVDGWYHTGDAGFLDEAGFLTLVDRVKDMLITGGENVYPAEVENVLLRHPAIDECAVVGLPDEKWGEAVHAVVKLRSGGSATAAELQQFCRAHLAGYKVPKSVEFSDRPLPKTPVGKLNKRELKRQLRPGG